MMKMKACRADFGVAEVKPVLSNKIYICISYCLYLVYKIDPLYLILILSNVVLCKC